MSILRIGYLADVFATLPCKPNTGPDAGPSTAPSTALNTAPKAGSITGSMTDPGTLTLTHCLGFSDMTWFSTHYWI